VWRLNLEAASRMGAHRRGYPRRRSRVAGSRRWQAGQRVKEANEVAGEQHGADVKLMAVTAGPEGGQRRLTMARPVRSRKRTALDVQSALSSGWLGSR
jgi:hypothetical protein